MSTTPGRMQAFLRFSSDIGVSTGTAIPETDSGLTTTELEKFLIQNKVDLRECLEAELDTVLGGRSPAMTGISGGSGNSRTKTAKRYNQYVYS